MTPDKRAAWIEALLAAQSLGGASAKQFALLRDLAACLEQGQEAWQRPDEPIHRFPSKPWGENWHPVLILDLSEKP